MPIRDFECCKCHHRFDSLIRSTQDLEEVKCPACGGTELQLRLTFAANYSIKGNNSASTRPNMSKRKP